MRSAPFKNIMKIWSEEGNHKFVKLFLSVENGTNGGEVCEKLSLYCISSPTKWNLGKYIIHIV
jgi:hypothetical protein